jgi:uncharacterized protein YgiM (DUF1202 family)
MPGDNDKKGFAGISKLATDIYIIGDEFQSPPPKPLHTQLSESENIETDAKTTDQSPPKVEISEVSKTGGKFFDKWMNIGVILAVIFFGVMVNLSLMPESPSQISIPGKSQLSSKGFTPNQNNQPSAFEYKNSSGTDNTPPENQSPVTRRRITITPIITVPYHVTAVQLNIRDLPGMSGKVVRKLIQFDTVNLHTGSSKNGWVKISSGNFEGWTAERFLAPGDGNEAKQTYCRASVTRPFTGHVFYQNQTGPHQLTINNAPDYDVIVKLKDVTGSAIISFYVRGGERYTVTSIPSGRFKMQYASGRSYCEACGGVFLDDMKASEDPSFTNYEITSDGYNRYTSIMEYTLYRVTNGNLHTKEIPVAMF